ncbi:hypothetical protein SNOG_13338 [Parastagonospora nodorum SN15]|uniref:Uncharacterized protein n=1 Tax=Phaeosphaeria nodorum (strain SN15 / ATCC MYA-4574 / FGSC 10173) TaxID=321614 RepID=Q0U4H6_PHANO|nr:hypothetical protein SNOG_13338 [Parastagonospora nodorum SN15]EAT79222.1 hypothetical protein SNOG_13338 [Parastagonospora nodorum SN15]
MASRGIMSVIAMCLHNYNKQVTRYDQMSNDRHKETNHEARKETPSSSFPSASSAALSATASRSGAHRTNRRSPASPSSLDDPVSLSEVVA